MDDSNYEDCCLLALAVSFVTTFTASLLLLVVSISGTVLGERLDQLMPLRL